MKKRFKRAMAIILSILYLVGVIPYAKAVEPVAYEVRHYVKMEEYPKPAYIEIASEENADVHEIEFVELEEEPVEAEDPLNRAHILTDVKVTYYCCERYSHICGNGDGLTATGDIATPYVSVAVDPKIIPLGSNIAYDYGDGDLHYGIANDVGGSIKQKHIDVCVTTHKEALDLDDGHRYATVYWWD